MAGGLTSGVDNIIRIKKGTDWKDGVSKSYDLWLEDIGYLAEQAETVFAETETLIKEIRSFPAAELEAEYDRLVRLYAEVGF